MPKIRPSLDRVNVTVTGLSLAPPSSMSTTPVWVISKEDFEPRRLNKRPRHGLDTTQSARTAVQATQDISRVHRLKIPSGVAPWPELCSLLSRPAPMLESLSLELMKTYDEEAVSRSLDNLFSGTTPRLRHLSIEHCHPGSLLLSCSNLTILEIRNPTPQYSVSTFLSVLRNLPRLIALHMACTLQPPEKYDQHPGPTYNPVPGQTRVVSLPSLAFFSFYGLCFAQDLDFLSHLSFPSSTILLFASGYPYHYDSPYAAVTDFLNIYLPLRQGSTNPTKIDLLSECARLRLNFWDGDKMLCGLKLDSEGGSGGDRHWVPDDPDVTEMFSLLSFSSVIEFSTSCYIVPALWPAVSSTFPALKYISIEELHFEEHGEVAPILTAIIDDYQSKPPSLWTPILPRLRHLSLKEVAFDDDCRKHLIKALRSRGRSSSRLETFRIEECRGVNEEFIDELDKVEGLSVHWIKRERGSDDAEYDVENEWESYMWHNENGEGELDIPPGAQRRDTLRYEVDNYIK
ncbi:hypothetical protein BDN72DRAFT_960627 [Pluteus cervinus]|uniref:Uncharacterized protein n=1 Tax=Pluteus cervinus TaxID=181527 RepID=A0ACD3ARL4_9AGAR|nr:hypothetical protein BDN72DRAFT_960627 [Pluteus cervinus]